VCASTPKRQNKTKFVHLNSKSGASLRRLHYLCD
jgi:hypothetical protein